MHRFHKAAAALAAVAVLGAACGDAATEPTAAPPATAATTTTQVSVQQFMFDQPEITITAGQDVTWANQDRILHTVTAGTPDSPTPDLFDRDLDGAGATTTIRFDEPGTYPYFCSRHPHMRGVIVVAEA